MTRRGANGEGTIYRRKDGRYEGAVYVLTTSDTRKRLRVYGKTRATVHTKLTEAKTKEQQGIRAADKTWSLGDYLDYWLGKVVRPNRRPATYAQCEIIVRLYLKPELRTLQLSRLSVPLVQSYLNRLLSENHSIAKVQVIRKVLSSALTRAEREELITRNVARLVELPSHQPPEVQPWSADEAQRFLTAAQTHRLYAAFLLLLLCGLRRGEVLGLRWQDVDFSQRELHIRQQLQRIGHELLVGPVKTRAGRRDLPLVGIILQALRQHQSHQIRAYELVFTTSVGTPIEPRNFVRSFVRVCQQHRLRVIKVHDLRHTAATMLKNLGVPARDAQLILGHARITTTQELYQHGDMTSRRQALDRMEAALTTIGTTNKDSQAEEPGSLMGVLDGNGSRQISRQGAHFVDTITSFLSGAGSGTLTHGLFHGKSIQSGSMQRTTEVQSLIHVRTRQWILGIVAVNLAVKLLK